MKHCVCAVWDEKLQSFMRPYYAPKIGGAVRAFSDEVNRAGSEMGQHPEDYTLFELGTWNDEDGTFKAVDNVIPRRVVSAVEVQKGSVV